MTLNVGRAWQSRPATFRFRLHSPLTNGMEALAMDEARVRKHREKRGKWC